MVDKIDRPEAPAPWRIKEPGRTKDDRPSQQQQESKEQKKERFEKRAEGRWQKFDSRTMIIKPMRIALRDIRSLRFRNVTFHGGIVTIEGDLEWMNGRITEGAMLVLAGIEEYMRVKRLPLNAEVPREIWARTDPVEIGIPQERTPSGSFSIEEMEQAEEEEAAEVKRPSFKLLETLGLVNKDTGAFQWATLVLYLLIAVGLALAIHGLLTMTRT